MALVGEELTGWGGTLARRVVSVEMVCYLKHLTVAQFEETVFKRHGILVSLFPELKNGLDFFTFFLTLLLF